MCPIFPSNFGMILMIGKKFGPAGYAADEGCYEADEGYELCYMYVHNCDTRWTSSSYE